MQARTLESTEEFSCQLDKAMRVASRNHDAMRLLPDTETVMAQRTPGENARKQHYGDE